MRPEDILTLLRRQPFIPFRIHLSNGQTYDIRHPEMAIVTKAAIVIAIPSTDTGAHVPDHFALVAPIHINNIEPLPVGSPASSGGHN